MSFAKWENMVRYLNDQLTIFTEVDSTGQVNKAFASDGRTWSLEQA